MDSLSKEHKRTHQVDGYIQSHVRYRVGPLPGSVAPHRLSQGRRPLSQVASSRSVPWEERRLPGQWVMQGELPELWKWQLSGWAGAPPAVSSAHACAPRP